MHHVTAVVSTPQHGPEAVSRLGVVTCFNNFHVLAQLGSCLIPSLLREIIYVWGNSQGHTEHLPEESTVTIRVGQRLCQTVWLYC